MLVAFRPPSWPASWCHQDRQSPRARPQVVSVPGHGRAGYLLCHLWRQLRGPWTGTREQRCPGCL